MITKKGEVSEGTVSCICKKTDDIFVTEERDMQPSRLNENIIYLFPSQIIFNC